MEGRPESTISLTQLPVGYRFKPTEEELVTCYLMKKVKNQPLPQHIIHEVNVYEYSPDQLTRKYLLHGEYEWFFFSSRNRKYPKGTRPNRNAGDGYWKMTGSDSEIIINGVKVASRKNLDYYAGSHKQSQKTNWKMHEYVPEEDSISCGVKRDKDGMKLNQWVLCKIYESNRNKQRKSEDHMENVEGNIEGVNIYDAYLWMRDPKSEDENEDGSLKDEYFNRELPAGYRFEPTEEELVTCYLKNKVCNQPLPRHKIRQLDVYKHSPLELTETLPIYREEEWYIFSSRNRKYPNGARPDRAAGNGFWKVTATDSAIEVDGVKVASKRKLDYYTGSYKESGKTIWKMYEYILLEDNSYSDPTCDRNEKMLNDLVLCKIYKNGRSKQRNEDAIQIKNQVENEGQNGHDTNSQINNNESNVLGEMGDDSFCWDYDQLHNRNSGLLQDIVNGSSASRQNVPNQHTESYSELQSFQQNDQRNNGSRF